MLKLYVTTFDGHELDIIVIDRKENIDIKNVYISCDDLCRIVDIDLCRLKKTLKDNGLNSEEIYHPCGEKQSVSLDQINLLFPRGGGISEFIQKEIEAMETVTQWRVTLGYDNKIWYCAGKLENKKYLGKDGYFPHKHLNIEIRKEFKDGMDYVCLRIGSGDLSYKNMFYQQERNFKRAGLLNGSNSKFKIIEYDDYLSVVVVALNNREIAGKLFELISKTIIEFCPKLFDLKFHSEYYNLEATFMGHASEVPGPRQNLAYIASSSVQSLIYLHLLGLLIGANEINGKVAG